MELRRITELADRRPFQPFEIELDNGTRVAIRHSENLIFFPHRAKLWDIIAYDEDRDRRVFFQPAAVSALTEAPEIEGGPATSSDR